MGGQSVNGGTHEEGHRPYGEDLTLIGYISLNLVEIRSSWQHSRFQVPSIQNHNSLLLMF